MSLGLGGISLRGYSKIAFTPCPSRMAKKNEFMWLQQGKMSALKYAYKFIKPSQCAPTYVADERLKMNCFEAGLNTSLKEDVSAIIYLL